MRGCVGALDGMAVKIRKPTNKESRGKPWHYYNRKGFYAMNLQACCDADRRFLWASVESTGSTHDSTAFSMSSLGTMLYNDKIPSGYWLSGDAAYRAHPNLVTPWPGSSLPADKDALNYWQSNSRIMIECAFGILSMRWGILWRPLNTSLANSVGIVFALMSLHNMCIDDGLADSQGDYTAGDGGDTYPTYSECGGADWCADDGTKQGRRRDLEPCAIRVHLTQ
mmetsp:Transcript_4870/g.17388  ORF Transcript_4870/g.17388 Transcript_4870/m.17388 type:complete len:224 (+) Transcript_4870:673-1344(+)